MKLFNVEIKAIYEASYEGDIERDYTKLVFAETKEDAIDFVNDDLKYLEMYPHIHEKAINAYIVDSNDYKRKTQYYKQLKIND